MAARTTPPGPATDAATRLQTMLHDRWVIHDAVGVLMATRNVSAAAAAAILGGQAKDRGMPLRAAAEDVIARHSARTAVPGPPDDHHTEPAGRRCSTTDPRGAAGPPFCRECPGFGTGRRMAW